MFFLFCKENTKKIIAYSSKLYNFAGKSKCNLLSAVFRGHKLGGCKTKYE